MMTPEVISLFENIAHHLSGVTESFQINTLEATKILHPGSAIFSKDIPYLNYSNFDYTKIQEPEFNDLCEELYESNINPNK